MGQQQPAGRRHSCSIYLRRNLGSSYPIRKYRKAACSSFVLASILSPLTALQLPADNWIFGQLDLDNWTWTIGYLDRGPRQDTENKSSDGALLANSGHHGCGTASQSHSDPQCTAILHQATNLIYVYGGIQCTIGRGSDNLVGTAKLSSASVFCERGSSSIVYDSRIPTGFTSVYRTLSSIAL